MSGEKKLIEQTAQVTAKAIISELRKQGLMKDNKRTPFQKTETLLYNYNNFQAAIDDKLKQIETIRAEGIPKKSASISSFSSTPTYEIKTDEDKVEEKIKSIQDSIQITYNFIKVIDNAVDALKNDTYFKIIQMKYFEGHTAEEMAEYFGVDISTISRNKNRLINILQIRLFSDDVIYQIFS